MAIMKGGGHMSTTKLTLADVATQERQYLETIFALGDGHFGVRAALPFTGNQQASLPVMLVNGFYATNPISYGEPAYGYAKQHQTIVSLPSPRYLNFATVDADASQPDTWQVELVSTELDLATAVLTEKFNLTTVTAAHFELTSRSQVLLDGSHRFCVTYQLTSHDYVGDLSFERPLFDDGRVLEAETDDPRVAERAAGLTTTVTPVANPRTFDWTVTTATTQQTVTQRDVLRAVPAGFDLVKTARGFAGHGSIDLDTPLTWQFVRQVSEIDQPLPASRPLDLTVNQQVLTDFWHQSRVEISDPKLQKGIQYNLLQLLQAAGRNGQTNIAAKGLTGPGYEGHYFWDTEMYMLPFFIFTNPAIAKQLLVYRYNILAQARDRAREVGVARGALFPWRTINGEEASAYFPAGTAQYHINADIAHAVKLYFNVTADDDFLRTYGAPIVLETARFWLAFGSWQEHAGRKQFCLYKVTGPDEYTALVDNNYYTNRLAKENLAFAAWLLAHDYITGDPEEQAAFTQASAAMYLPYDATRQLTLQDDNSPAMPAWPFGDTPKAHYPLLLHYHPLMIYRHRVNKQADTLLAEMLFPQDQDQAQLGRDYDYYEKITTHDSSLSRSIFSILASRLDRRDKAFSYYMDTSLMDLVDLQGNARDGLHEANLGGSWLGLTYGFAGLGVQNGQLTVTNHLPSQLDHLSFRLRFRGRVLAVSLTPSTTVVRVIEGTPLTVMINGAAQVIG